MTTRRGLSAIAAVFFVTWVPASPLPAEVDCTVPGRNTPAVPVPECVDFEGSAASCGAPGSIRLWPVGFQPASPIPPNRDTTDRVAGKGIPGWATGHELFSSLDVVTVGGVSRRLYVAYNAGLQAWNIDPQADPDYPANPPRMDKADGWEGEFLQWPVPSEVLSYIEDISALNVSATIDVVAVAGKKPAGLTLWEFDTSTESLRQLYQDVDINARQVRLIRLNGGAIYAVVGSEGGVAVYDVTAARALVSPCLDDQGSVCPGILRGYVTQQARQYIGAIHVAGNDRVYVSSSNGTAFQTAPVELWELANPAIPSAASLCLSSFSNVAGSELFLYNGHHYLAFIIEETGFDNEELRVLLIDDCISDCVQVGGCFVQDAVNPVSLDPAPGDGADYSTARDLLTYSEFAGRPYLYYGVATGGLQGPDFDQLFDLRHLRPPTPSPLTCLPEVTATGGSYTDPCNGSKIRYWSHYYSRNAHGLNEMVPRIGQLSSGGYFYRAAATILDVHALDPDLIFVDGFECGEVGAWSLAVP